MVLAEAVLTFDEPGREPLVGPGARVVLAIAIASIKLDGPKPTPTTSRTSWSGCVRAGGGCTIVILSSNEHWYKVNYIY